MKGVCIRDACVSNTCARDTYAKNASSTMGACIKDAGRKTTYTRGADAIKYSRIHSQSFSISDIKLFNTGQWSLIDILLFRYSFTGVLLGLETGVGVG